MTGNKVEAQKIGGFKDSEGATCVESSRNQWPLKSKTICIEEKAKDWFQGTVLQDDRRVCEEGKRCLS